MTDLASTIDLHQVTTSEGDRLLFTAITLPFRSFRICQEFAPGLSIAQMMEYAGMTSQQPARIFIDDRLIRDGERHTIPGRCQIVTVRALPKGGGQGKNPEEIFLQLAVTAVTALATWGIGAFAAAAVFPAFGVTGSAVDFGNHREGPGGIAGARDRVGLRRPCVSVVR